MEWDKEYKGFEEAFLNTFASQMEVNGFVIISLGNKIDFDTVPMTVHMKFMARCSRAIKTKGFDVEIVKTNYIPTHIVCTPKVFY